MESSYQTDTRAGEPTPPLVVAPDLLATIKALLRGSPEVRKACWFCARPLVNGTCVVCDA